MVRVYRGGRILASPGFAELLTHKIIGLGHVCGDIAAFSAVGQATGDSDLSIKIVQYFINNLFAGLLPNDGGFLFHAKIRLRWWLSLVSIEKCSKMSRVMQPREAKSLQIDREQSIKRVEGFGLPEDFTLEQRQNLYQGLALLHDLADEVMAAVNTFQGGPVRKKQHQIASRYATQLHCSADVILAFYNEVAFQGRPITSELQEIFEGAFRNAHFAYHEFREQLDSLSPPRRIDPQSVSLVKVIPLPRPAARPRKSKSRNR